MSIQSEIDRIKAGKADAKAALIERGVDPGDVPIDEYGNQIRAIPTGVTSFNGRGGAVKPQAGDYTSEMVGAIDQNEKGRASGVASLDDNGKVPAGQLPEMNYDPAGSAQTVQQALNTHAANKTLHVTAVERQAWNNKAPGTHTHTAAQVGALPISGGTMTGALNMNGKALTNLPAPKNNKDAVPKDYVDSLISSKKGGWTELERITSSKTWVVPEGITQIGVFLLGGGQSGQGCRIGLRGDSYMKGSAKGGASGWGKSVILNVTPGQQIKAVIGSGGVCTNGARAAGGDTLFGSYSAMGGGKTRSNAEGVQDVSRFDYNAAYFVQDVNSPFGGVSGLAGITFDDYDYGVVSWISTAVEEEKNIFLPTMKVFGLGECIALKYRDDYTIEDQYKTSAVDLGTMGKAGVAKVYTFKDYGEGRTYKGGDASGYGNGGGACISCTAYGSNKSITLGGNGSPGIIIIYV